MGVHPNTMLMVHLKPDGLAHKTYRDILAASGVKDGDDIDIGGQSYHHRIMEGDYEDGFQVSGDDGDIVLLTFATYGYGERIAWADLVRRTADLTAWAQATCDRFACTYIISVGANYW